MALKATIFRLKLQVADLDRHHYQDYALTIARHPSETDARMMLRVLAFALHADERLEFGRGISTDEDPDLCLRGLDGSIDTWIALGTPGPDRLKKACGRSARVLLYSYGDRAVPVWLRKHDASLRRLGTLTIRQVRDTDMQALAQAARAGLELQCTISDGEALVSWEDASVNITPGLIKAPGAG